MDSALPLAFGAGLLAVVNPCALGMIPAYLALRAGSGAESHSGRATIPSRTRTRV